MISAQAGQARRNNDQATRRSDAAACSRESKSTSSPDLAVAALVGRYIERREHNETPCVHDLLAATAEFGDTANDVLRTVLACYEAMRAHGDSDPSASRNRAASAAEVRSPP